MLIYLFSLDGTTKTYTKLGKVWGMYGIRFLYIYLYIYLFYLDGTIRKYRKLQSSWGMGEDLFVFIKLNWI